MSKVWADFAVLPHDDAEALLADMGYILAAIHRAFVDGDWMAVAYDKKGRKYSAKGRNPHEAVCKITWELWVRREGQKASTGRK